MKEFLRKKNIIFSAKRYGIDALGAMAQGLFASLLIGTIISTPRRTAWYRNPCNSRRLCERSNRAAMAISIGVALQCPPLVLFHWRQSEWQQMNLGCRRTSCGFGRYDFAAEFGKLVSKETKIDIIVTPL